MFSPPIKYVHSHEKKETRVLIECTIFYSLLLFNVTSLQSVKAATMQRSPNFDGRIEIHRG